MPDDSVWDDADVSERETASLPDDDAGGAKAAATPAPSRSETSVIKSTEDVVRVLAERGEGLVKASTPSDARPSSPRSVKTRKVVEKGDGRCGAYAPRGTKCKLCGKVHP
jgi:hypothetical protein